MKIEDVYRLGLEDKLLGDEPLTNEDKMLLAMDSASSEGGFLSRLISLILAMF